MYVRVSSLGRSSRLLNQYRASAIVKRGMLNFSVVWSGQFGANHTRLLGGPGELMSISPHDLDLRPWPSSLT